jgi:phage terminase large subunit-like protein
LIASAPRSTVEALIDGLSDKTLAALPYLFEFWGRPEHQLPPPGDWTTWVVLGGRGAGKTRTGTEWVRGMVEGGTPLAGGSASHVAMVAETWEQAREVMVHGDSGVLACSPADRRPAFISTRRMLQWPNGAEAHLFSAADPESLRGPQFDAAWSDELAKWRVADEAWSMLQFCLRLGDHPRQVVTTTPRDVPLLHALLAEPSTVMTTAPTVANQANLAANFLSTITRRYVGTDTGRQELGGELIADPAGSLFPRASIEPHRLTRAPKLDRIVVAVDPPVTSKTTSDECGIVVAGISGEKLYVLADRSLGQAEPMRWAGVAAEAYRTYNAACIVVENNQGGDMVTETLRHVDPFIPVRPVTATKSKAARAEPVSVLYSQGRVHHVGIFSALEDQLVAMGKDKKSPDRADALVWAITTLMPDPAEPRIRSVG